MATPYDALIAQLLQSSQFNTGADTGDPFVTYYDVPGAGQLLDRNGLLSTGVTTNDQGQQGAYGIQIDPATGQVIGTNWNTDIGVNRGDMLVGLGTMGLLGGAAAGLLAGGAGGAAGGATASGAGGGAAGAASGSGAALSGIGQAAGATGAIANAAGTSQPDMTNWYDPGNYDGTGGNPFENTDPTFGFDSAGNVIDQTGRVVAPASSAAGLLDAIRQGGSALTQFASANPWVGSLIGGGLGALAGSQDMTSTTNQAGTSNQTGTTNLTSTTAPSQQYLDAVAPQIQNLQNYAGGSSQFGVSNPQEQAMLGYLQSGAAPVNAATNSQMGNVQNLVNSATGGYSAATNPYATPNNPYTQALVQNANNELTRAYNSSIAPKFSSGSSFGSSGLGFAEVNALNDLQKNLANQTNSLLYQDYNQAANLAEQYAGRSDAANQFGANASLQGAGLLGSLGANDASQINNVALNNANRYLTAGSTLGSYGVNMANLGLQSQEQAALDAYRRATAGNSLFGLNLGNTTTQSGTTTQNGTTNQVNTTTAPGNAWTGALGGAILGGQATGLFSGGLFGR